MQLLHGGLVDEDDRELGIRMHVQLVERVDREALDRGLVDRDRLVVDLDRHVSGPVSPRRSAAGCPRGVARFEPSRLLAFELLGLLLGVVLRVRVDDPADEAVPHDVGAREPREVDVVDVVEHPGDQLQPARAGGQVDLGHVAGDHHLRAEPEAGEEHLHLLRRRVLRLVEHDERVVERAAAHVGERGDLDRSRREQLGHDLGIHHLVERVVERAQVRVDLVGERAGQEAEPLPASTAGRVRMIRSTSLRCSACTAFAIAR